MKSRTLTILNVLNWLAIAAGVSLVVASLLSQEGGGTVAALATVTALTAVLWVPVLLVIAVAAFILELRFIKGGSGNWWDLLKTPSPYVLLFLLYIIPLGFFG